MIILFFFIITFNHVANAFRQIDSFENNCTSQLSSRKECIEKCKINLVELVFWKTNSTSFEVEPSEICFENSCIAVLKCIANKMLNERNFEIHIQESEKDVKITIDIHWHVVNFLYYEPIALALGNLSVKKQISIHLINLNVMYKKSNCKLSMHQIDHLEIKQDDEKIFKCLRTENQDCDAICDVSNVDDVANIWIKMGKYFLVFICIVIVLIGIITPTVAIAKNRGLSCSPPTIDDKQFEMSQTTSYITTEYTKQIV